MALTHSVAPAVRTIAERLINKHEQFRPLRDIRIEYVFRSEAQRTNGKIILGKARKITGMNALMATPDLFGDPDATSEFATFFALEIGLDTWDLMNFRQREALVFHELCHFAVDVDDEGNAVLWIRPHDVEAFAAEVQQYGPWKMDLYQFFMDVGGPEMLSDIFHQVGPPEHFEGPPATVDENGEIIEGPWAASQAGELDEPPSE